MNHSRFANSKHLLCTAAFQFFVFVLFAQNKTYYVSPAGNDANDGLTTSTAWQTTAKVSGFSFQPGDKILFEGGQTFTGFLEFQNDDNGTTLNPVVISSYGTGKAIISTNTTAGLYAYNVGGMEVQNLTFAANGATNNTANGVEFYMEQTSANIDHIVVNNVEVYGYGGRGILLGGWGTTKGYNGVRITNCIARNNGRAGIEIYHSSQQYINTNVYVAYCRAYQNDGRSDYTANYSGSGIIVSGTDGALVEYCEAFENGKNNAGTDGGPIGIWFHNLKNGTIQFCESHHNKAGLNADGGGFDLDGGCQNCTVQYCYSHDNEGAGYGLFEYGSDNAFTNNVVRYNISQNDGRKNDYGGIVLWGMDASHKITNTEIYNNTVYVNNAAVVNGTPSAVMIINDNASQIHLRNNIFYVTGGANMLDAATTAGVSAILFQNNNYYAESTGNFLWGANTFTTLNAWKAAATGQEMLNATSLGSAANPLLVNAGGGGTIGPASGGDLLALTAYQIQGSSALINAGLNLSSLFGINPGTRDFYNNPIPVNGAYDVGAHEFGYVALPVSYITLSGRLSEKNLYVNWMLSSARTVEKVVVEISTDGRNFLSLKEYNGLINTNQLQAAESIAGNFPNVLFCRAMAVGKTGEIEYSKIVRLQRGSLQNTLNVYPVPANNTIFVQSVAPLKAGVLVLRNAAGQVVLQKGIAAGSTSLSLDLSALTSGVYMGELKSNDGLQQSFKVSKQ